jgi:hypothetical protein
MFFADVGRHLQMHMECLQHRLETMQSLGQHLPLSPRCINFLVYLVDLPLAFQQNNFSRLQNRRGQMLQGLPICPHCQIFLITNTMQIMRATIRLAWARAKAKPQSA